VSARGLLTILYKDVKTLLDGERGVEDDESEAEGENVIASADLEELSYGSLYPTSNDPRRIRVSNISLSGSSVRIHSLTAVAACLGF
jgi:hypothetical protein